MEDNEGNEIGGLKPNEVAQAVIRLSGVQSWKTMDQLDMNDIGNITATLQLFSESSYENIHRNQYTHLQTVY